ncbi:sugar transporter [Fomitiporia mediterranea MF3/22]|uniref:sugar transporter n=1 Tax=Fomitiporia mediterranea (strain MF3/22) TaxID=694068 RepID=UPI0004409A81|nr:sugar transporter [Fomitiporia mediterranea MF3/22]EJD07134.1 sugar transporter [Fomitiporia mediterranea MF3/22]
MGLVFNVFAASFIAIGSFLFGYDSGIIASVITMSHFKNFFHNPASPMIGAVVSTFTGGCFFGAAASGWWNDRFGRKRTIQIGCIWALWGCAMQGGANNVATLLIGRIVAGVAIGCLSMTVPLYNTEIAPPKIRGFIVGLAQQMIGIGFVVANWVGYGSQFIDSNTSWRLPLSLQLIPAFLLLVGVNFLPYSPRWLLEKNRDDEARLVVYRLYGVNNEEEKARADEEFAVMHDAIKAEMMVRSRNIRDLWVTPAMVKRTLAACGVQIFGQFTGINVINYYGPIMYETLGLSPGKTLLVQGIYGAVGPITNFFFITLFLDRIGRKRPLLFGAATFVCTFSILAAIVSSFPPGATQNLAAQRAGIAMIFLTSIVFSLSFGPISWVLASEVFPTRTRALGTAVATCCNWAFNVLFSEVSPIGLAHSSSKFYILFVCLNAFSFVVIFAFFPETKGKSLEDMAEVFGDQVDPEEVLAKHGATTLAHRYEVESHHEKADYA